MKNIICYGDSNTFGFNPKDCSRFDENTRWTALLQKSLGDDYNIVDESACDRTGVVNNPKGELFSAPQHFPKLISKSEKVDLIILGVGTNDLQSQYNISFDTVEKGLKNLVELAKTKTKTVIILPPVVLNETVSKGFFSYQFNETSIVKSKKIGEIYKTIADNYQCEYFDINNFATPSEFDGLHYDEAAHKLIADKLSEFIKQLFICN